MRVSASTTSMSSIFGAGSSLMEAWRRAKETAEVLPAPAAWLFSVCTVVLFYCGPLVWLQFLGIELWGGAQNGGNNRKGHGRYYGTQD